jgi:hypothetical protein
VGGFEQLLQITSLKPWRETRGPFIAGWYSERQVPEVIRFFRELVDAKAPISFSAVAKSLIIDSFYSRRGREGSSVERTERAPYVRELHYLPKHRPGDTSEEYLCVLTPRIPQTQKSPYTAGECDQLVTEADEIEVVAIQTAAIFDREYRRAFLSPEDPPGRKRPYKQIVPRAFFHEEGLLARLRWQKPPVDAALFDWVLPNTRANGLSSPSSIGGLAVVDRWSSRCSAAFDSTSCRVITVETNRRAASPP